MSDPIDRQAAIDILCRALHYNYEEGYAVTQMLALPSAQSETCEYWDNESNYCALYRPSAHTIISCPMCPDCPDNCPLIEKETEDE